jgi:hypothetical protein
MSAHAIAEPIARKGAAELANFPIGKTDAGIPRTHAAPPEKLTDKEVNQLAAESKDYEDFMNKAIAIGQLTGDFTIDRHIYILPYLTGAEIDAEAARLEAENPGRFITAEKFRRKTQ